MIRLLIGPAAGFALGSKLGEGGLEDLLQIAQQTPANEQVAGIVRTGAGALGDALRMFATVLTEGVPTRLAERPALQGA